MNCFACCLVVKSAAESMGHFVFTMFNEEHNSTCILLFLCCTKHSHCICMTRVLCCETNNNVESFHVLVMSPRLRQL